MDNNVRLELARNWYNNKATTNAEKILLKNLFPELVTSKDERIKKAITHILYDNYTDATVIEGVEIAEIVAWLEKQGEQKPVDKVEPKFKIDDWIYHEISGNAFYINKIENHTYISDEGATISFGRENDWRLWTIDDAKDGDVLANKSGAIFINAGSSKKRVTLDCYCYLSVQNEFCIENPKTGSWFYKNEIKPATEEQRNLLFQKMKEAGYEWNENKKVLVMIGIDNDVEDERYEELMEDNETNIKQNLAWSEEDGDLYTIANNFMPEPVWNAVIETKEEGSGAFAYDYNQMVNMFKAGANWLKSIRPHWKPTQEQMQSLYLAIITYSKKDDKLTYDGLNSLYDDLEKL